MLAYINELCIMAYNNENFYKRARKIIEVYNAHKHTDIPDTRIIKNILPKYGIYISYRQWMNIKGMVIPKENV